MFQEKDCVLPASFADTHQRARADVIAALAYGARPGIRGLAEDLAGVNGKMVPYISTLPLLSRVAFSPGTAAVVKGSGPCPLGRSSIIEQAAAT
jgi:hypothetical protein